MTPKMPETGPVGRNLIANVERLRREQGMSLRGLSAALEEVSRPIPALGLTRMTRGERRVDVDELVALATVLGVTPAELLADTGGAARRSVRSSGGPRSQPERKDHPVTSPATVPHADPPPRGCPPYETLERLLTAEELADYLGVTPKTLANWRSQGIGPDYVRVNSIRYRPSAVARWLDDLERRDGEDPAKAGEEHRAYMREAQRRSRSHRAGDHSACLPGRCPHAAGEAP